MRGRARDIRAHWPRRVVGTLVPFEVSINGQWLDMAGNATDPVGDHVGFATCSFTGSNGDYIVLQGILNL
jgi:hypothetical protein